MIDSQTARKTHVIAFAGNVDNIKEKDGDEKKSRSGAAAQQHSEQQQQKKQENKGPTTAQRSSAANTPSIQTPPLLRPLLLMDTANAALSTAAKTKVDS